MKMFEKKRLHPVAAVSNTLKQLKEAIFPIILAFVFGSSGEDANFFEFLLIYVVPAAIVLFTIISGVVKWLRFTYWIEDEELRIEHGLFVKKKRYIPIERIQSVSTSEGIIQRIFGLVQLNVETAGGGLEGAEGSLTAITKDEAQKLEKYIKDVKRKAFSKESELGESMHDDSTEVELEIEQEKNIIYRMNFKEIFLMALTSGGALGIIAAVLAFLSQFDELISFDRVMDEVERFAALGIIFVVGIVIAVILVAYLIAIIRTMLSFANFTVEIADENIIISKGLLERKKIMVPIKRVQAIKMQENVIRGFFGFATVYVISGGGSLTDADGGKIMICPFVKKKRIAEIIESCIPEYNLNIDFNPVPKRAKFRYILRPLYWLFIPIGVGIYFLYPWGLLLGLALPVLGFIGYTGYKFAGWNITDSQLALRSRFINSSTVYMFKNKIQAVTCSRSILQKRKNLGSVSATVMSSFAGETGETVDLDEKDVQYIYTWFSRTH